MSGQSASWFAARALTGVAALGLVLFGVLGGAPGSASAVPSGANSFTIGGSVFQAPAGGLPATACSNPATLDPGVTRCWVFTLDNHLDIPLSVTSLTMSLDPNFPPPPSGCAAVSLDLPAFSGDIALPASGTAVSPGLPIRLINTSTNQDDCQLTTMHLAFSGMARQPDSNALASTGVDATGVISVASGLILFGVLAVLARRDRLGNEVDQ